MAFKENPYSFDSTAYNQTVLVADFTRLLERNIKPLSELEESKARVIKRNIELLSELEESKAHVLKLSMELQKAQEEIASLKSYNKLKDQCKDHNENGLNLSMGEPTSAEHCSQCQEDAVMPLDSATQLPSESLLKEDLRKTRINLEVYRLRVNDLTKSNEILTSKLQSVRKQLFHVSIVENRLRKEIVGTQKENGIILDRLDKLTVAANAVIDSDLAVLCNSLIIDNLAQACGRKPVSEMTRYLAQPPEMTSYLAQVIAAVLPVGCRLITKGHCSWNIVGNCPNGELEIRIQDRFRNEHTVLFNPLSPNPLVGEFTSGASDYQKKTSSRHPLFSMFPDNSNGCGPGPHL